MNPIESILRDLSTAFLVDRLVARFEKGQSLSTGTLRISNASPEQRSTIDNLLGRKSSIGPHTSLSLDRLNVSEDELLFILEKLRGPLINRSAQRRRTAETWDALFLRWEKKLAFLADVIADGLLKRISRDPDHADELLSIVHRIISKAPHGNIHLASLAARLTGDSHALDRGKPLSTLILRASGNADRRSAWSDLGVVIDDLSAPVLCLNLPAMDLPWITWHCENGEPYFLPLRQHRSFQPAPGIEKIYVCENPAIVSEAAIRLGPNSHPLICTNGIPNSTVKALLTTLAAANIPLHIRADFDWPGIRIVDDLCTILPSATPWRMTPTDYQNCGATRPLTGTSPAATSTMPELVTAMTKHGLAAYEENLIETLEVDLGKYPQPTGTEKKTAG